MTPALTGNHIILVGIPVKLVYRMNHIIRCDENGRFVDGINHRLDNADIHVLSAVIVSTVSKLTYKN